MVWAELPPTPEKLELKAINSMNLKTLTTFLDLPLSASSDYLPISKNSFHQNTAMNSPELFSAPSMLPSIAAGMNVNPNSSLDDGSKLQIERTEMVAKRATFKPTFESKNSGPNSPQCISDDSHLIPQIFNLVSSYPKEEMVEISHKNDKCNANNNNNNIAVSNKNPSKCTAMFNKNNNLTAYYLKEISTNRNWNLLEYSQAPNQSCTNKNLPNKCILPLNTNHEREGSMKKITQNKIQKTRASTKIYFPKTFQNRPAEEPLNLFVNKGFCLDAAEDGIQQPSWRQIIHANRLEGGKLRFQIRRNQGTQINNLASVTRYTTVASFSNNGYLSKTKMGSTISTLGITNLAQEVKSKNQNKHNNDTYKSNSNKDKSFMYKPLSKPPRKSTKWDKILERKKHSWNFKDNFEDLPKSEEKQKGLKRKTKLKSKTIHLETSTEAKGLLKSCSIPIGIWDEKKFIWNKKREKNHIQELRAKLDSYNPTIETIKPLGGEPLGPKFFSELCNLWPDLIARLALDINLEATSPDSPPDPPDPPNEASITGLPFWSPPKHEPKKSHEDDPVLVNKCCSPNDPSCPQLPLQTIVPDPFEEPNKPPIEDYSGGLRIPRTEDPLPNGSETNSPRRTQNTAPNDSPRLKRASPLEIIDMRRSSACQSPICGSPRPRAPCPIAEISEFESLESEDPDEDEEIIISSLTRAGEYEEVEDVGEEGDEEEEEEEEGEVVEQADERDEESESVMGEEDYMEGSSRDTTKSPNDKTRRRLLPEIPKNKTSFSSASLLALRTPTLAEEIQEAESGVGSRSSTPEGFSLMSSHSRPILVLKCHSYIRDDTSSPETDLRLPPQDIDSGHSTQHSPDGAKSMSPQAVREISPLSPGLQVSISQLEVLDATHRGLYRFIPRHSDEVEIEIGDPIYVQKEADDLWCEGVNLRSGLHGIFPAAHVTDVDYSDFDPTIPKVKKERYLLNYLGSIETLCHKGNQVLCQAVRKIAREDAGRTAKPTSCILEVSDHGIRMVDKSKPGTEGTLDHEYFYHLKHISFCGFHPKDPRYFGFITKHPAVQRFACHVFESADSTRPVAEAVGRAFQRFYKKFIETAYPTEDIYIE